MISSDRSTALSQQLDYYRARATEYDQWWLRKGRYDRGHDLNEHWFTEGAIVSSKLCAFRPSGRILEFAGGTGLWSKQLLPFASELTVLDGSPEMLAINAARLQSPQVSHLKADIFQWQPTGTFDTIFFSFWLSHVPPERFVQFWALVASCLAPGGRVFFVDSRPESTSSAIDHHLSEFDNPLQLRRLNDGREFQVYKIFYEPNQLSERLHELGWEFQLEQTERYFLFGSGQQIAH